MAFMNFETESMNPSQGPQTFVPPAPPPPGRWRKRLFRWVLGISLLINLGNCSHMLVQSEYGDEEFPPVVETLAYGQRSFPAKVALLRFEGVIMREAGGFWGSLPDPVTSLLREIQAATMDDDVQAILLEVNSPGGGVTASDEIYQALVRFRESDSRRRIVVLAGDMAASGAYYFSLPADIIVAQPTSVIGSVGVLIGALNFHQLAERLGLEDVTLTSGENKAMLSAMRPIEEGHRAILQDIVDSLYTRFRDLVLQHRPFDAAFAKEHGLLDGRIFTASEAKTFGLVDEIGYGPEARDTIRRLLGEEDIAFYTFSYSSGLRSLFQARGPALFQNPLRADTGFLYLWRP